MKSEDWFPTRIWFDDLQLDLNRLKYACLDLEKEDPVGVFKSNMQGWQSQNILSHRNVDQSLKDLLETAEKLANESPIREDMGCNRKFRLGNSWANINRKGHFNMPHKHPHSVLSACVYISCKDLDSKILFQSPKIHQESYEFDSHFDPSYLNHKTVHYDPIPARILFFPSWLIHFVEPNNYDDPRISIAMNFTTE